MKIISWNINGIRALKRNGFLEDLLQLDADIMCLQETKAEYDQLSDGLENLSGYEAYFWSSQERKGHSGVACYSRQQPENVLYGFPATYDFADTQGRVITLIFKSFTLVNAYFPNGASATSPLDYKLNFYETMLAYVNDMRDKGHHVVITGDWNVAHTAIDLARPQDNKKSIGFLPEERAWLDTFHAKKWIDVWRHLHPETLDVYTYWDTKSRARDRNVGWRIDYFFCDEKFLPRVKHCEILTDVFGSDHCPLVLEF